MNYTDADIPIECPECKEKHIEEGVQAMYEHILEAHPDYNQHEADVFASRWLEDAWDRYDQQGFDSLTPQQQKAYRATQNGR